MHAMHRQKKQCFVIIIWFAFTFVYEVEFVYLNEIICISQTEVKNEIGKSADCKAGVVCHNLGRKIKKVFMNISKTLGGLIEKSQHTILQTIIPT